MGYLITRQDAEYFGAKSLQLNLKLYSSLALNDVRIHGFHSTNTFSFPLLTTTADYVVSESNHSISDFPRDLVVFVNDAITVKRGQLYGVLSLKVEGQHVNILANGYLTSDSNSGLAGGLALGTHENALSGAGYVHILQGTDIGADEELNIQVPNTGVGAVWNIRNIGVLLTQSTSSSQREVTWSITNSDSNVVYKSSAGTGSSSSSGNIPHYFSSYPTRGILEPSGYSSPQFHIRLGSGDRIQTSTSNMDSNDNYQSPYLLIEEWINV